MNKKPQPIKRDVKEFLCRECGFPMLIRRSIAYYGGNQESDNENRFDITELQRYKNRNYSVFLLCRECGIKDCRRC